MSSLSNSEKSSQTGLGASTNANRRCLIMVSCIVQLMTQISFTNLFIKVSEGNVMRIQSIIVEEFPIMKSEEFTKVSSDLN